MPTPGQKMDALDLLRTFAEMHEDTEDALDAAQIYEKSVRLLLTKYTQAKITDSFEGEYICRPPGSLSCSGDNFRGLFSHDTCGQQFYFQAIYASQM